MGITTQIHTQVETRNEAIARKERAIGKMDEVTKVYHALHDLIDNVGPLGTIDGLKIAAMRIEEIATSMLPKVRRELNSRQIEVYQAEAKQTRFPF